MPRWLKLTLAGVAAIFVLAFVALVILVNTIDVKRFAALAAQEVEEATGRKLKIRGKLDISVFPRLAIVAENVSFANAPWGSRPEMAKAKRIEGSLALLPLLRRKIDLTRLVLIEPDVLLETDAKGVGNWVFKPAATASQPAEPSRGPDLEVTGLVIERGTLAFRNGPSKRTARLAVRRLRLKERMFGGSAVDLDAVFRDQRFTLKGTIGTIGGLLAKDAAWPVSLTAATDGAHAKMDGTVDWSQSVSAFDLALKAEVKNTAGISKLAGAAIDVPTPAALSAKLVSTNGTQTADPLRITLGKSTIDGRVMVRSGGARPFFAVRLASKTIDLTPLAKPKRPAAKGARVFSDAPLPLGSLRGFDGDADIAIDRLVLPNKLPLEAVRMRAALKSGRVDVQPLAANLGGGSLNGRLLLDASKPAAPTLAVNLDGQGISMARVATALGHAGSVSGGNTDLTIRLSGPGESLHRFVGWGTGEVRVMVGPARISGAALDAGGGALTSILDKANPFRRTDPHTDVKCAVVRLPVRKGVARSQRTIAYETAKVNMVVAGQIDLRTEALDLAIRPTVKEGLGIGAGALAELVRVTGTLAEPSAGIDTLGSARAALSVGGAVMTGGLSLLGEVLYAKATADPRPCQTALAGGAAPKRAAREPEWQQTQ